MMQVTDFKERQQLALHAGELDVPALYVRLTDSTVWAYAHELRAWRASQNTSAGDHT